MGSALRLLRGAGRNEPDAASEKQTSNARSRKIRSQSLPARCERKLPILDLRSASVHIENRTERSTSISERGEHQMSPPSVEDRLVTTQGSLDQRCNRDGLDEGYASWEHFTRRGAEKIPVESFKAPLLLASCESSVVMRHVQKLMVGIIINDELYKEELLLPFIRGIIILQNDRGPETGSKTLNGLLAFRNRVRNEISGGTTQASHQREDLRNEADVIWDKINTDFDSEAETMRTVNWFHDLEKNGTIHHVVDCLGECVLHLRMKIMNRTLHQLLPSKCKEKRRLVDTVYAVGSLRWGKVREYRDGTVSVYSWSVDDVRALLEAHRAHLTARKLDGARVYINWYKYHTLWGDPDPTAWSEGPWDSLIKYVSDRWASWTLDIQLPDTCSLSGLLECVRKTSVSLSQGGDVFPAVGNLEALEASLQKGQSQGLLQLQLVSGQPSPLPVYQLSN